MKTSPVLLYRPATAEDVNLLAKWNHQLIRDEGHRNPMTVPQLRKRMAGWLASEYKAVLFELDGDPVAYALYRENVDEIYLRQLFVKRTNRSCGVGGAAMQILRRRVWPKKRLTVSILCKNLRAIAFYRKHGCREYAVTMEIMPTAKSR